MQSKSILSKTFKNFIIITFIMVELLGFGFCVYRYFNESKAITQHHEKYHFENLQHLEDDLKRSQKNLIFHFTTLSILVAILGLLSNIAYQKKVRKIQQLFDKFAKVLAQSVKKHQLLKLDETEFYYREFEEISKSINQALSDIDYTENYNSLTGLPKREKFLQEIDKYNKNIKHNIIVCYIYFKGYEQLLLNQSFNLADKAVLDFAKGLKDLEADIGNSIIGKVSGNGDFLYAFPCTVTPSYCIGVVSNKIINAFKNIKLSSAFNEQRIGLGYDIIDKNDEEKEYSESLNNAYRAALLASVQTECSYFTYSEELRKKIQYGVELEKDLEIALKEEKLQVFYQGKIGTNDDKIKGAEALVRWKRNDKFENTEIFIKIAEKTQMIITLENFVIKEVFKTQRKLQDDGMFFPISVNISAKHLEQNELIHYLAKQSKIYNINPQYIEIEITERQKLSTKNIDTLNMIKTAGFSISIDDFGKDYSSLSYINNLPIDTIKIDKSFIDGLDESNTPETIKSSKALVGGIIKIAKQMHKKVIAEGVETAFQVDILKSLNCDELQGYYYYPGATPMEDFRKIYASKIA